MFDIWMTRHAEDVQVALFFSLFLIFAIVEIFAPGRPRPMARQRRWWTNLALTALNIVVLSALPVSFFTVAVWSRSHGIGVFNAFELPVIADNLFAAHKTSIKPNARPTSLVTSGPYAVSRNPMYLGFGLLVIGVAMMLGSATPLILALAFFPLADHLFIRSEEANLRAAFASDWTS